MMADKKEIPAVMIESPFSAATLEEKNNNLAYARAAVQDSLQRGESPLAPHLWFTEWLDDNDKAEREHGFACLESWMAKCDRVAVYTDRGLTRGIQFGIGLAFQLGKPVEWRTMENEENEENEENAVND